MEDNSIEFPARSIKRNLFVYCNGNIICTAEVLFVQEMVHLVRTRLWRSERKKWYIIHRAWWPYMARLYNPQFEWSASSIFQVEATLVKYCYGYGFNFGIVCIMRGFRLLFMNFYFHGEKFCIYTSLVENWNHLYWEKLVHFYHFPQKVVLN